MEEVEEEVELTLSGRFFASLSLISVEGMALMSFVGDNVGDLMGEVVPTPGL